jgi:hypothetical protein
MSLLGEANVADGKDAAVDAVELARRDPLPDTARGKAECSQLIE